MSVLQNINGSLYRMDASDLAQLAAVDTEGILGGTPGATTNGQTLVDQLAADDVQAQTDIGQIKTDLSDYHVTPSKNRAIPNGTRRTLSSVTYTEEENGVIDANGTATGGNSFYYISERLEWPNEEMVLSGCPSGGDASTYRLIIASSEDSGATVYASDTGSGVIVPANTGGSTLTLDIYIRVAQNASVSHKKFSPMLCSKVAYDADPTYVPYFLPMRDGMFLRSEQAVLGAKNLLENTASTQTVDGVTFTKNADATMTGNGTSTAQINLDLNRSLALKAGTYIVSCGVESGVTVNIYKNVSPWTTYFNNKKGTFTLSSDDTVVVQIVVANGIALSNVIIKPMIRLASDPDDTYVPYAMTNRALTDAATLKESSCTTTYTVSTSQGGNHLYKKGSTVQMLLALEGVTVAAFTTVANIPSGYRPVNTIVGISMRNSNVPFYVSSGGTIQFGSALNSANATMYLSWLTNE